MTIVMIFYVMIFSLTNINKFAHKLKIFIVIRKFERSQFYFSYCVVTLLVPFNDTMTGQSLFALCVRRLAVSVKIRLSEMRQYLPSRVCDTILRVQNDVIKLLQLLALYQPQNIGIEGIYITP